jgi:hypothetical protein
MPYDPQGPAPLLNRAWARRGWASPPPFGKSVPALMAETTITFVRQQTAPDTIGGWGPSGTASTLWEVAGHVESVDDEPRPTDAEATGFVITHHYELFVPIPDDPTQMPRKGDWARFSDGASNFHLPLVHVGMRSGLLDHLEIWTEQVE